MSEHSGDISGAVATVKEGSSSREVTDLGRVTTSAEPSLTVGLLPRALPRPVLLPNAFAKDIFLEPRAISGV